MHSRLRLLFESIERYFLKKGWRYWIGAALILALTVVATPYVDQFLNLSQYRDRLFQKLSQLGPRAAEPRFVKVVLVFDDEFWHRDPKGIRPINRHYLARLVDALDKADASIIALDFNLHIPQKDAKATPGNYSVLDNYFRNDTDFLMRTIARVAANREIVLPKTLEEEAAGYRLLPDIYQPYGICEKPLAGGSWLNPGTKEFPLSPVAKQNIRCGYIELPYDMKQVPPVLDVDHGLEADPFSLAIVRIRNDDEARAVGKNTLVVTYIPMSAFYDSGALHYNGNTVVSARDLLAGDPKAIKVVKHQPVIVGGAWHKSYDNGPPADLVDMYATPVGSINGALIHENFTEAILDGRLNRPLPHWLLLTLEILFGIGAAIFFASYSPIWIKLAGLGILALLLLTLQWVMLLMFGVFFEAFLPLLGLAVHSVFERLAEPRTASD
jgi:CHASE2 domain-containing sensor protein